MESLVTRFAAWYTPIVVAACAGVAFIPMMAGVEDKKRWVYLALLILVTACPCALVLSTPVTVVASLAAAARQGVLIKVITNLHCHFMHVIVTDWCNPCQKGNGGHTSASRHDWLEINLAFKIVY